MLYRLWACGLAVRSFLFDQLRSKRFHRLQHRVEGFTTKKTTPKLTTRYKDTRQSSASNPTRLTALYGRARARGTPTTSGYQYFPRIRNASILTGNLLGHNFAGKKINRLPESLRGNGLVAFGTR